MKGCLEGLEVAEPTPHHLCTFWPKTLTSGVPLCTPITPCTPPHPPVVVLQTPIWFSPFPQVVSGPPCTGPHPSYPPFSSRSRPVLQVHASLHFEPPKINIFHRDCKRSGRDATCLAAFLCFRPVFLAPHFPTATVGKQGPPPLPAPVSPMDFGVVLGIGPLLKWVLSARPHLEPPFVTTRCPSDTLVPGNREGTSCQGEEGNGWGAESGSEQGAGSS